MIALMEKVQEFYKVYGLPQSAIPSLYTDRRKLREQLLEEEHDEYLLGEATNDIVEIADALADMLYIIAGTALEYGIPLEEVFNEVHRSNMSKLDADGKPVFRPEDQKVLKGPSYTPPNIQAIIDAHCPDAG